VNGPGVCVRCEGKRIGSWFEAFVTRRSEVGREELPAVLGVPSSIDGGGRLDFGEDCSIARAYALERVLNAVGEVVSTSALSAVTDLAAGIGDAWIFRDSLGRLGGD
jgi:hypothetical protein